MEKQSDNEMETTIYRPMEDYKGMLCKMMENQMEKKIDM